MSLRSRVNKSGYCEITQYSTTNHIALDLVGKNYTIDDIVSHSDGVVETVVKNINYNTYGTNNKILGNYILIKHDNFYTLYAHLEYNTIKLNKGDRVVKGQIIGRMGNTGYSNGTHLHFEMRDINNNKIDPINYLDKDYNYINNDDNIYYIVKKGDTLSSIAKKYNTKVDIIVKNNNIVNKNLIYIGDRLIINSANNIKYLKNEKNNTSIVDALKQINIDSSFNNRKRIAILNGINNYTGTSIQNTQLLELLKKGLLINDNNG